MRGSVWSKKWNRNFVVSWKGGVCGNGGSKIRGRRGHAPKVAKGLNAFLRRATQRVRRADEGNQWRKDWEEESRIDDGMMDWLYLDEWGPEEDELDYPYPIDPLLRMWGFGMLSGWEEPKRGKGSWLDKQLGPDTYCQLHGYNAGCDCDTNSYDLGWEDDGDDYAGECYDDEDWERLSRDLTKKTS